MRRPAGKARDRALPGGRAEGAQRSRRECIIGQMGTQFRGAVLNVPVSLGRSEFATEKTLRAVSRLPGVRQRRVGEGESGRGPSPCLRGKSCGWSPMRSGTVVIKRPVEMRCSGYGGYGRRERHVNSQFSAPHPAQDTSLHFQGFGVDSDSACSTVSALYRRRRSKSKHPRLE